MNYIRLLVDAILPKEKRDEVASNLEYAAAQAPVLFSDLANAKARIDEVYTQNAEILLLLQNQQNVSRETLEAVEESSFCETETTDSPSESTEIGI